MKFSCPHSLSGMSRGTPEREINFPRIAKRVDPLIHSLLVGIFAVAMNVVLDVVRKSPARSDVGLVLHFLLSFARHASASFRSEYVLPINPDSLVINSISQDVRGC